MKEIIEVEVDTPDGFRCIGYGKAKKGQWVDMGEGMEEWDLESETTETYFLFEPLPQPTQFKVGDIVKWGPDGDYTGEVLKVLDGHLVIWDEEDEEPYVISMDDAALVGDDTPSTPAQPQWPGWRLADERDIGKQVVRTDLKDWDPLECREKHGTGKLVEFLPGKDSPYRTGDGRMPWKYAYVREEKGWVKATAADIGKKVFAVHDPEQWGGAKPPSCYQNPEALNYTLRDVRDGKYIVQGHRDHHTETYPLALIYKG